MADRPESRPPRDRRAVRWLLAAFLVVGCGLALTAWRAVRADRQMRAELLRDAEFLVPGLAGESLRGPADSGRDASLGATLRMLRRLSPAWRRLYLLAIRPDGSVSVVASADAAAAPSTSHPRAGAAEVRVGLARLAQSRRAVTAGPWTDAGGLTVSAFAPVQDASSSGPAHVLGLDFDAGSWWRHVATAALLPALLTLVLGVLLLAGFLTRPLRLAGQAVPLRRWNHRETALVTLGGVVVSLGLARIASQSEDAYREDVFAALMRVTSAHVSERFLNLDRLQVEGLGRFFEGSQSVTDTEFRQYVAPLVRAPEVRALGWAPVVEHERDAPFRCPIFLLEAAEGTGVEGWATGVDLAADEALAPALARAAETRRTQAAAVRGGKAYASEAPELVIVRPVFDPSEPQGALQGYTLAAVDLDALLSTVLGRLDAAHAYILLDLLALAPDGPPSRVVGLAPPGRALDLGGALSGPMVMARPVPAFDGTYLVVARPSERFLAMHGSVLSWVVLYGGLFLTVVGVAVVRATVRHGAAVERFGRRCDVALRDSERRYGLLEEHSRTVTWTVDTTGLYTSVSGLAPTVYGYQPSELVGTRHYYDLHPSEGRALFKAQTMAVFSRQESFQGLANPIVTKEGVVLWVSTNGEPLFDEGGKFVGYQGTDTDVTYRKDADLFCNLGIEALRILRAPGDTDGLLGRLVSVIKEETGFTGVGIRLWNGDDYPFVAQEGFRCGHAAEGDGLRLRGINGEPLLDDDGHPCMKCVCGAVVSGRRPRHCAAFSEGGSCWSNDTSSLADALGLPLDASNCLRRGGGSLLAVPISDDTGIVGVLQMNDEHRGRVSVETVRMFECIAAHIGEALMRKRVEQDYHELFRQMQEGSAIYEVERDDTGHIADYRVLAVNPAFERLTGLRLGEIVGRPAHEMPFFSPQRWMETIAHVVESGERAVFQDYFARAGRHFRFTVFRPKPEQFAVVFTDITEQVMVEEQLRQSRRQHDAWLSRLQGMAYRRSAGNGGTMEFVSPGSAELTGHPPEDFVASRTVVYDELVVPEDRERYRAAWDEAIRTHGQLVAEYRIVTQDGAMRPVREHGVGVYDERGCLVSVEGLVVSTDGHG